MTKSGKILTIDQCAGVLRAVGTEMVLIGGQAVALWARQYQSELNLTAPATSKDIDFWGDRTTVIALAKKFKTRAQLPGKRDFTVLSGIVRVSIEGELVSVDVLHAVPGVDEISWDKAATTVQFNELNVLVLDPISLIASKLHNLRHFDQEERNDAEQLKLSLRIAQIFLARVFLHNVKTGLGYVKRLIKLAQLPPNQATLAKHGMHPLRSIPIDTIRRLHADTSLPQDARERLGNFLMKQWPRLETPAS